MNEPKQLSTLEAKPTDQTRPIEYVPPSPDTIRQYAHAVCRRLYVQNESEPNFTEFFQEFTAFVRVIVRIQTKYLNRREPHV
jgi:hypothetical protein